MILPKRLGKNSRIGLISPSEPVYFLDRLEKGIEELEGMGFECVLGEHAQKKFKYMAGTDEERAEDINNMFLDESIDGIITITGGSSANRILPLIDYDNIKKNPKVFLGISDISVLLNSIYAKTDLVTFHGPYVLYGICEMSDYNKTYFKKALMSETPIGEVEEYAPRKILKEGKASGKLVGGNMSSFRSLIGTEYEPDWKDSILFWEEYKTEPHTIDRMLMHLKLTGVFDDLKGMLVGNLTKCKEKKYTNNSFSIEKIIHDHCDEYDFPIIYNMDFGHDCQNATLPIGVEAKIDTYNNKFSIDERCVL